jgi:thymidylate synthase (FAD)
VKASPDLITAELVDYMGSDISVVNAARTSFAKSVTELSAADIKLIDYLAKNRHTTPFRHVQISLRCKAPIFLARQLGKHQAGFSWNETSRRYVKDEPVYFLPEFWRAAPEGSIKQGSGGAHSDSDRYMEASKDIYLAAHNLYSEMIADGVAPELARMVLPQSMVTEWVWSGSLFGYFFLWKERSNPHAQLEAQSFAVAVDSVCEQVAPYSWAALKKYS